MGKLKQYPNIFQTSTMSISASHTQSMSMSASASEPYEPTEKQDKQGTYVAKQDIEGYFERGDPVSITKVKYVAHSEEAYLVRKLKITSDDPDADPPMLIFHGDIDRYFQFFV